MRLIPNYAVKAIPALALIALASVIALSFLLTANSANAFDTDSHNNAPPQPNPQLIAQCSNGIAVLDPTNNPGLVSDCANLLAAKDTLIGDSVDSDEFLNWSADIGIHRWDGVEVGIGCDSVVCNEAAFRVIRLEIRRGELTGAIPPELGNLAGIIRLEIRDTELTGAIPSELGNLTNLIYLNINDNPQITGTIPSELGNLASIRELRINENRLTGAIPPEIGSLANLEGLDLSENQLTGSIPPELGNLGNLENYLDISYNQLTGIIPPELGNLANLGGLYLNNNQLTGIIPPELGNLANLGELGIGDNQFTGCIPDSLRRLFTEYRILAAVGLPFCDPAPVPPAPTPPSVPGTTGSPTPTPTATASPTSQSTHTPSPTATSVSTPGGDGRLTTQCSNGIAVLNPASNPGLVADCAILLATRNTLIGDSGDADALNWSADIGIHRWDAVGVGRLDDNSAFRVTGLHLDERNELYGTIPSELGNLSNLTELRIEETQLTGAIPPELGILTNLGRLVLEENTEVTGEIPPELGNLANLRWLELRDSQLAGAIPAELGNLVGLQYLHLNDNQLTGIIPPELGNLANLSSLEIGGNQFTGCIPNSLSPLLGYEDLADLGLPFCDAAPVPPAPTPPTLPTATPTSVSGATASPTSQPTHTPSPTATSESGGDTDVQNRLSALEALVAALKAMIAALEGRMAALEASPSASAPTAARTATSTSVANVAAPTPTATFVAGIAPTATPTPDACIRRIAGIGWITGSWSSACSSARKPIDANAPAGTRYARFYTFTLDAPADVTVTLTSQAVNNTYLYLLSGIGRNGVALHENGDIDAENGNYGSRIAARLPAGSYTVEATAYNLKTAGNFTLTVDMAAVP